MEMVLSIKACSSMWTRALAAEAGIRQAPTRERVEALFEPGALAKVATMANRVCGELRQQTRLQ